MDGQGGADGVPHTAFGRWVRSRRIELLMTQEELAERSGLSVRTVRNLEAGRGGAPRLETRRLAIAVLGEQPTADARAAMPADPPVRLPAHLPADVAGFTGRTEALRRLDTLLAQHRDGTAGPVVISAIDGTAGVGKTALAVHWGHRVRGEFPDGQLYVDLRGFAPALPPLRSIQALARFLRALGVPAEHVPTDPETATDLYRTLMADRRLLVVLDNARDPDQVRPLLPGGTGNLVLVTSRDQLGGLIAREGAARLTLGVLDRDEATALLQRILGAERTAAEPHAVADLARLCAGLPLALRIAATNLHGQPSRTIADFVAVLRPDPLDELAVPGDPQSVVQATFDLSYVALPDPARRLFRRLGLVTCPDFTAETAAVLAEVARADAGPLLDLLAGAHLVQPRAPGRYGCHDLLQLYACRRADAEETPAQRAAAIARLDDHYLGLVDSAATLLYPSLQRLRPSAPPEAPPRPFDDAAEASAWLDAERANLTALIAHAADRGPRPVAWLLADGLRGYFTYRMHTVDWLACAEAALAAAVAADDRPGQAAAQLSLGTLHRRLGDKEQAIERYGQCLALARQAGWVEGKVAALGSLGNVHLELGRLREASGYFTEVLTFARRNGQLAIQASVLSNLGLISLELGRLHQAAGEHAEALVLSRRLGSRNLAANALSNLGETEIWQGRHDSARPHLAKALALHREIGDRDSECFTLCNLAALHRDRDEYDVALRLAAQGLELARSAGHRRYEIDAYNTVGTIHHRLRQTTEAMDCHRQALDGARATGYRPAVARALLGEADVHEHLGNHPLARDCAEQALAIARADGYRVSEGQALTLLAAVHLGRESPRQAAEAAEAAIAIHRETGCRPGEERARRVLADATARATAGR